MTYHSSVYGLSSVDSLIVSTVVIVETLSALNIKREFINSHSIKDHYKLESLKWALLLFIKSSWNSFPSNKKLSNDKSHSKK